jgi:predicted membrane-bound dolichyl-phosphate-mannose-protein mannosyltransferase
MLHNSYIGASIYYFLKTKNILSDCAEKNHLKQLSCSVFQIPTYIHRYIIYTYEGSKKLKPYLVLRETMIALSIIKA